MTDPIKAFQVKQSVFANNDQKGNRTKKKGLFA